MYDDSILPAARSDAARAFDDLRAEVSLLRRAIEGLTAERQNMPDYSPTLAKLDADLEAIKAGCRAVSERPALKLTPMKLAEEIVQASEKARLDDQRLLVGAQGQFSQAAERIDRIVARARACQRQKQWLIVAGSAGIVLGMALLGGFQAVF